MTVSGSIGYFFGERKRGRMILLWSRVSGSSWRMRDDYAGMWAARTSRGRALFSCSAIAASARNLLSEDHEPIDHLCTDGGSGSQTPTRSATGMMALRQARLRMDRSCKPPPYQVVVRGR